MGKFVVWMSENLSDMSLFKMKPIKNKKSMDLNIWNIILGFVVVAAVAAILFFGVFKPSLSKSLKPLNAVNYEILNNRCRVEGRDLFGSSNQENLEPLEKESDGFPTLDGKKKFATNQKRSS